MSDLLFELFSEEIPARMQVGAARDMLKALEIKLTEAGLAYNQAEAFYGPRRLTFSVTGLPARQEDRTEERKGPKENAPKQAIEGFLRGAGLASLNQAELRETPKGKVWFAVQQIKGQATAAVLPQILLEVIYSYTWPKSQRWARTNFRWVRPLHRILAVFDGQALDGSLDMGGGEALGFSNLSEGHRFLSPGTFKVSSLSDLETKLKERYILLRVEDRKAVICEQLNGACVQENLNLIEDTGLLSEVAGLAEWPTVVMGTFDENFLAVPEECLILSMKEHQKYFAARKADGTLANVFFTVSNMVADDNFAVIRAGNERVLNARLADAKFFYEQDLKQPLANNIPKLDKIVFHAKMGSLGDKVKRMKFLAREIALALGFSREIQDQAIQAVRLIKADLVSQMVFEFPELQGLMGRTYALFQGYNPAIADAIAQHYQPIGPSDFCPKEPVSVVSALTDKFDTLANFWWHDEKPTGSKDPYALRRAALGIIRILRESDFNLNLFWASRAAMQRGERLISDQDRHTKTVHDLVKFIFERLTFQLRNEGFRADVLQACQQAKLLPTSIKDFVARAKVTQNLLSTDLIAAYKRANNILRKSKDFTYTPTRPTIENADEMLSKHVNAAKKEILGYHEHSNFAAMFNTLGKLRKNIDAYFEAVMINADDLSLRNQRLSLLADFVDAVNQVADLSKLEG